MNFVVVATMEITMILYHCVHVKPTPDGDKTLTHAMSLPLHWLSYISFVMRCINVDDKRYII